MKTGKTMKEISKERLKEIAEFRLPSYKEIPDVGLYLDQTAKYINECLKTFESYGLTNSMISNYVKQKIISNPVKKQYYRDQIASLLFIVLTKNVLSLDKINTILELKNIDTQDFYTEFSKIFEDTLHKVFNKENLKLNRDDILNDVIITSVYQIYLNERMKYLEK